MTQYRKRNYKKKYTGRSKSVKSAPRYHNKLSNNMSTSPVPSEMNVKLKYVDTIALQPGAGTIAYHLFSTNGLYDPDITAAGHQPMGFDQWMTFYEHYTVTGCKISATFVPSSATVGAGQQIVGIYTDSNITPPAAIGVNDFLEQPGTRFSYLSLAGALGPVTVTKTFSAKNFFSRDRKSLIASEGYKGNGASNPTEQAYFNVFCGATDNTSDPPQTQVSIIIEYTAVFSERRTLIGS